MWRSCCHEWRYSVEFCRKNRQRELSRKLSGEDQSQKSYLSWSVPVCAIVTLINNWNSIISTLFPLFHTCFQWENIQKFVPADQHFRSCATPKPQKKFKTKPKPRIFGCDHAKKTVCTPCSGLSPILYLWESSSLLKETMKYQLERRLFSVYCRKTRITKSLHC
jgi:hypothetical protein